jgi:hypothetical protein
VSARIQDYWPTGSSDRSGGETVAIEGEGFEGATAVAFGPFAAHFQVSSDTEIMATAPAYVPGYPVQSSAVTVRAKDGSTAATNGEWTWGGSTLAGLVELDRVVDPTPRRPVL